MEERINEILVRLEELREEWTNQAYGIERTHGDKDSAALAMRTCISDLGKFIQQYRDLKVSKL